MKAATMKYHSILSFLPLTVTSITTVVYLLITISLLIIHVTVPPAPKDSTLFQGFNLTEAWLDLCELSNGYHPFNSRRNDEVREWLLLRIKKILDSNQVNWVLEGSKETELQDSIYSSTEKTTRFKDEQDTPPLQAQSEVVIFDDQLANYTSTTQGIDFNGRKSGISTYFEGNNIIVYIRGAKDKYGPWWKTPTSYLKYQRGNSGVLVNAHFDSVSTGYGATDDGVGVVTALQLIKYFSTDGNRPERGIVALFNNNEEDGLYGAKAFLSHPMALFIQTFLNLEGAGAGGRATLFRSTDLEVTRAYSRSPYPFGSVVSADGFSLKYVRSETDYAVFHAAGYRGLDVAFFGPRSRYHSDQDDTKHTSKASIWHMLSASVETIKYLTTDEYYPNVELKDSSSIEAHRTQGSDGVWFDLFGRFFVLFGLRTLFAWSLSILIVTPIILIIVSYLLIRQDKYYLFTKSIKSEHTSEWFFIQGWHGAFRFPIVLIISSTFTLGTAFILNRINPFIIYSSQFSVWSMFLSVFFCIFWLLMATYNKVRPSALHRLYTLLWMFFFEWIFLIIVTVYEDRFRVGSGYIFVFNQGAIFLATLIGLCELFALPKMASVIECVQDHHGSTGTATPSYNAEGQINTGSDLRDDHGEEEFEPSTSEITPLIGESIHQRLDSATFSRAYRRSSSDQPDRLYKRIEKKNFFSNEQKWSSRLPTYTWVLQFLILAPFPLILLEQVGLLLVSATSQTGSDGSASYIPYLIAAIFSILILLPIAPFVHRITHHIPTFLLLIFIGTLIYNLISFPFSSQNRYKVFFQQVVDLDNGTNRVTLVGIERYIRDIIPYLPSAASQSIECTTHASIRNGLSFCSYNGITPNVVRKSNYEDVNPREKLENWLWYNITRTEDKNRAIFEVAGRQTKACAIRFNIPISEFYVYGAMSHRDFETDVSEIGISEIKLWHRDWKRKWVVDIEWPISEGKTAGEEGRSGEVVCLWSDDNEPDTIPALDELKRLMPIWATSVKLSDGLVEGRKAFVV